MSSTVRTPSLAAFSSRRRRRAARHFATARRRAMQCQRIAARHAHACNRGTHAASGSACGPGGRAPQPGCEPRLQCTACAATGQPGTADCAARTRTHRAFTTFSAFCAMATAARRQMPSSMDSCSCCAQRREATPHAPCNRTANCANLAARSEASASGSSKPSKLRRSAASCGLGVLDCMVCSQLDLGASCSHVRGSASGPAGAAGRRRAAVACARRRSLGLGAFGVAALRPRQLRRRGSAHRVGDGDDEALVRASGLRLRCARRREPGSRRVVGPRTEAAPAVRGRVQRGSRQAHRG